ncbi:unnamed protein product, partial [marine sediment metagenome]
MPLNYGVRGPGRFRLRLARFIHDDLVRATLGHHDDVASESQVASPLGAG